MRTVFLGTPEIAVPTLRAMVADEDLRPVGVFTQPPARRSRGGRETSSPVGVAARELGLEVHEVQSVSKGESLEALVEMRPEVIVVVAFGQILKKSVLELPRFGCVNLHPSMLPAYRGAAPVQRAILDGVKDGGLTVMRLVKKLDAGPILKQVAWPMDEDKNAEELLTEAGGLGATLMLDVLHHIDAIEPIEQKEDEVSFAPPLEKSDGLLDFKVPALELRNRVRAVQPWPRAEAWLDLPDRGPTRVIVHRAGLAENGGSGQPGEVLGINENGILVACGEGSVSLNELQLEGKPRKPARDVANGLRLKPGVRFRT